MGEGGTESLKERKEGVITVFICHNHFIYNLVELPVIIIIIEFLWRRRKEGLLRYRCIIYQIGLSLSANYLQVFFFVL